MAHSVGTHALVDLSCVPKHCFEPNFLKSHFDALLLKLQFHILRYDSHIFDNGGCTMFWLLSESHCSIHTWPERQFIALDLFTCGDNDLEMLSNYIQLVFEGSQCDISFKVRG